MVAHRAPPCRTKYLASFQASPSVGPIIEADLSIQIQRTLKFSGEVSSSKVLVGETQIPLKVSTTLTGSRSTTKYFFPASMYGEKIFLSNSSKFGVMNLAIIELVKYS